MTKLTFTSIFQAITGDAREAALLQAKADSLLQLRTVCENNNIAWTPQSLQDKLGVTKQESERLYRGKVSGLTTTQIVSLAHKVLKFDV